MAHAFTKHLPFDDLRENNLSRHSLYMPPTIASASSVQLGNHDSPFPASSRKRARQDSFIGARTSDACYSRSRVSQSPPPLANTKYRLANGVDTPTRGNLEDSQDLSWYSDTNYRRAWSSQRTGSTDNRQIVTFNALQRDSSGRGRPGPTDSNDSWGQFVFNFVGGIAGKMWDFCRNVPFSGFSAGGGVAYTFGPEGPRRIETQEHSSTPPLRNENVTYTTNPVTPNNNPFSTSQGRHQDPSTTERPAKRLHTSSGSAWVLVNHKSDQSPTAQASPYSPRPGSSAHRSFLPRPVAPRCAPKKQPRPSTPRASSVSIAGYSQGTRNRPASVAQTRSPVHSPRHSTAAQTPEVQRYTAERKREDASIQRLNRQLQAMIKEGKQALASKVEVEDEDSPTFDMDEDEGYVDADHDGYAKRW